MDGEISNYKRAIEQEQAKNENLTGFLNKTETEVMSLEKQIQKNKEIKEALIAKFVQYQKSLEQAEEDLSKIAQERRGLEDHVNNLQREGDLVINQAVKVDDQIRQNLQIQKTLEKSASSAEQGTTKLVNAIEDKVF
jgi:chromosome segregation ATPase